MFQGLMKKNNILFLKYMFHNLFSEHEQEPGAQECVLYGHRRAARLYRLRRRHGTFNHFGFGTLCVV